MVDPFKGHPCIQKSGVLEALVLQPSINMHWFVSNFVTGFEGIPEKYQILINLCILDVV